MKKETREKILGFGLVGILASVPVGGAALSCAKDVPVVDPQNNVSIYNPPREVFCAVQGQPTLYKEVWSSLEELKLSLYSELADGTRLWANRWSRFEHTDFPACLREEVYINVPADFPEEELMGQVEIDIVDNLCNGSVNSCVGKYVFDNGDTVDVSEFVCSTAQDYFLAIKNGVNNDLYNIDEQVNAWHERKGFEE